MALGLGRFSEETEPFLYMARLFSFMLILAAIVDMNRRKSGRPVKTTERSDGEPQ